MMKKILALVLSLILLACAFSAAMAEETVLQLWDVIVRDPHPAARDQVIAAFEAAHPGVKVEVTTITGDIEEKVLTASTAGTLPDVIFTWSASSLVTWGQMGIVEPVDFILDEYGSDYFLSGKQLATYQFADRLWGVPIVTFPIAFWYRADWLEDAGLEVPTTWDEWYDVALALTQDKDGDGTIDQYGSVLGIAEGWPFDDMRASNADYWYAADGSCTIGEKTVETLDFLRKLFYDTCYPGSVSYMNEGQRAGFLSGLGGTMVTSISFLNNVLEEVGIEAITSGQISVAPIPQNATAEEGAGASASTHAIGIFAGDETELAKEFVRFWLNEENLATYFSSNVPGHLPPYACVWENEAFKAARADVWEIYMAGRDTLATTAWDEPTVSWVSQFTTSGGAGKDVMAYVCVENLSSEAIVEKLQEIAAEAIAEMEDYE